MRATPALIRCLQVNFSPNDGECVRPNTFPQNEFSASALGGKKTVSWRFFLNKNSNACKGGITTSAMIPTSNGGVRPLLSNAASLCTGFTALQELYGLCSNGFQNVSLVPVAYSLTT